MNISFEPQPDKTAPTAAELAIALTKMLIWLAQLNNDGLHAITNTSEFYATQSGVYGIEIDPESKKELERLNLSLKYKPKSRGGLHCNG